MDCVTMVLLERETGIPLDLVVLINSFLYEKLTDENFKQAIAQWFDNEKKCRWRFGHISDWNTSRVTDMGNLFYNRRSFKEDLSRWNVSQVTNMAGMFRGAWSFNRDLSRWNVSHVTNMAEMFRDTWSFNGDVGQWNVSQVTNMAGMFRASVFNGDLSQWNVNQVTNMAEMFRGAWSFDGDVGQWNVSQVTNTAEMFRDANLSSVYLSQWRINKGVADDDLKDIRRPLCVPSSHAMILFAFAFLFTCLLTFLLFRISGIPDQTIEE
jgi:surface protein